MHTARTATARPLPGTAADAPAYPDSRYAWYVVAVLVLANTVAFVDRTILYLMVGPIRRSLQISDLQFSLLSGTAFALLYATLGIPIARYADRGSRVRIIALGTFLWSLMTALCGTARSFGQMFLARVGVGIGEAALSPAAFSMLSDYFPPARVTRALSVFSAAIYVGSGAALVAGGAVIAIVPAMTLPLLGAMEPWQVVFLCVGLPGLAVVALLATVREPARRGLQAGTLAKAGVPLREVVRFVLQRRAAYGYMIGGFAIKGMLYNGISAWIPAYFTRTFGWDTPTIGYRYGLTLAVCGTLGVVCGGVLGSRLRARGRTDAYLWVGIAGALAMLPGVVAPLLTNGFAVLALYGVFMFFASFPVGAAAAAIQEITPNQMRAQVSSLYLFALSLTGIGLGPALVAAFTDLVFRDDALLKYSLAIVPALVAPVAAWLLWRAMAPYRAAIAMGSS